MASDPVLLRHLKGHRGKVTGISFNPDGTRFVTSSSDSTAIVWNVNEQVRCMRFEAHSDIVNDICWSPDGRIVASASKDRTVKIWIPSLVGNCDDFRAHTSNIRSVHFNSNGKKLVTASDDKSVKLWRISRKHFVSSFTGHTNWVRCARFSPDDKLIASCGDDKALKLFDPNSGSCVHTFVDQKGAGNKVAWHPDGSLVAIGLDNARVKIYDIRIRKLIQYYRIFDDPINSLDFHASGHYLITGSEAVKIIDLLEGRHIYTLTGHTGPVQAVKFSNDGQLFTTACTQIMLWKANFAAQSESSILTESNSSEILQLQQRNSQQKPTNDSTFCKKLSYETGAPTTDEDEEVLGRFTNKENNHIKDTSIVVDARQTENFHLTDAVEVCD
ncbi:POC1 centriolar protein homolog isoform X2 [Uranotaenia lowii]|uniref:POC1 centriolar protein homolog isoform X2 n=1 Tax=Uranotaenia lowii TaxID=190385 RepID=UPI002478A81A|nr:POC1 centriolar protein homolog isoform X2 [Uranotaenia lowii]